MGESKIIARTSLKFGVIAKWTDGADPSECPRRIIWVGGIFSI